jgi:hypothetical protein
VLKYDAFGREIGEDDPDLAPEGRGPAAPRAARRGEAPRPGLDAAVRRPDAVQRQAHVGAYFEHARYVMGDAAGRYQRAYP